MSAGIVSQGTTITWAGSQVPNVTRVTVGAGGGGSGDQEISIATLDSCPCQEEPFLKTWAQPPGGGSGPGGEVQLDFMGSNPFSIGQNGTLSITGAALSYSSSGDCTCVNVQVTAQVADVVRGTATIALP
jgi:hypothetical protein